MLKNHIKIREKKITNNLLKGGGAAFLAGSLFPISMVVGWAVIPVAIIVGVLFGFSLRRIIDLSTILKISPHNADQLDKLIKLVNSTKELSKKDKNNILQSVYKKSECIKTKRESKPEDKEFTELDCTKEVLTLFSKEIKNYNIDPSKKKEIINETEKLKRELTIK